MNQPVHVINSMINPLIIINCNTFIQLTQRLVKYLQIKNAYTVWNFECNANDTSYNRVGAIRNRCKG